MEEKKEKRKSICVSVKPADVKANENLEQSIQTRCRIGSIRTNPPPLVGSHKGIHLFQKLKIFKFLVSIIYSCTHCVVTHGEQCKKWTPECIPQLN